MIRLHHGTDHGSATDLLANGIDAAAAARYNVSGEFWASTDPATADWFAHTNPAGGPPARFSFDFPESVLEDLVAQALVVAHGQPSGHTDYEFLPASYGPMNAHMTNPEVVALP